MPVLVHNSLTRKKEELVPLQEGRVGIYVCGPTVYGHSHAGHAKSYVSFDVIVKWLRRHYTVRYVQNITDVGHLTDDADEGEDKIGLQAQIDRVHPLEIVDEYMRSYFEDMEALGVAHPNMYVRATQHIGEQIELIERLVERGHAYVAHGNVYFDVGSWPEYGVLSGRQLDEQKEGTRVESRGDKRDPRDFALWKSAEGTSHILRWRSPWGEGYPGWHVECSAMATKYLGGTFDIHGGGNENKFPHHECEIAQTRAAGDGQFARYWLHNNMINVDGQKMGKSLGNSVFIKDILREFRPEALRLFLLSTHYSRPSNYTRDAVTAAEAGVDRLTEARARLQDAADAGEPAGGGAKLDDATRAARESFARAMDDDFNTPVAISVAFDFVKEVNRQAATGLDARAAQAALAFLQDDVSGVLGVLPRDRKDDGGAGDLVDPLMDLLLDLRTELRGEKNWTLSDLIRDRLSSLGVTLQDGAGGTSWSRS